MSKPSRLIACAAALLIAGCSTVKESSPARTATEMLLISSAADRGAEALAAQVPVSGKRIFVDSTLFEASAPNSSDGKYAISAIRGALSQHGAFLMAKREDAEMVLELRNGALSVDEYKLLFGLPTIPVPVPLTGVVTTPELAIFKRHEYQAVAKFGATAYDAASGRPLGGAEPKFETAERVNYIVLLFISWTHDTFTPKPDEK